MSEPDPPVLPPEAAAALLLLYHELLSSLEKVPESDEEILAITGADREGALEMMEQLQALLIRCCEPEPECRPLPPCGQVAQAVVRHFHEHPGSAYRKDGCYHATARFRRFVLGLTAPGQPGEGMTADELADGTGVPLDMIKSWLRKKAKARRHRSR